MTGSQMGNPVGASRIDKRRLRTWLLCLSFLVPYLSLNLPRLHLPGLCAEEAWAALPALSLLGRKDLRAGHFISIGGIAFPVSETAYHGALASYLLAPFLWLFGTTVEAIRCYSVCIGALTLLMVFLFSRRLLNDDRVAWGATFLLAISPAYISGTRLGVYYGVAIVLFQMAALASFASWHAMGVRRHLYLGCYLLGCALACYSFSILYIIAIIPFGFFFFCKTHQPIRVAAFCLGFFLLGMFPFNLYLMLDGKPFWDCLRTLYPHSYARFGPFGGSAILCILARRWNQIMDLVARDPLTKEVFPLSGGVSTCRAMRLFFFGGLLWLPISCCLRRQTFPRGCKIFLLLYAVFAFLVSPLGGLTFHVAHLFSILPILIIIMVTALVEFVDTALGALSLGSRTLLIVCAGLFLGWVNPPRMPSLIKTMRGVSPCFTDGVYGMADWLRLNTGHDRLLPDYWLYPTVDFLTGHDLNGRLESLAVEPPKASDLLRVDVVVDYLAIGSEASTTGCGLFNVPVYRLIRSAEARGELKRLKTFYNLDGTPMMAAYKVMHHGPGR